MDLFITEGKLPDSLRIGWLSDLECVLIFHNLFAYVNMSKRIQGGKSLTNFANKELAEAEKSIIKNTKRRKHFAKLSHNLQTYPTKAVIDEIKKQIREKHANRSLFGGMPKYTCDEVLKFVIAIEEQYLKEINKVENIKRALFCFKPYSFY